MHSKTVTEIFKAMDATLASKTMKAASSSKVTLPAQTLAGYHIAQAMDDTYQTQVVKAIADAQLQHPISLIAQSAATQANLQSIIPIGVFNEIGNNYHGLIGANSAVSTVMAAARSANWASSLLDPVGLSLSARFAEIGLGLKLNDMTEFARAISQVSANFPRLPIHHFTSQLMGGLSETRFKVAALVGANEMYGVDADLTISANNNLFGEWRTQPNLPQRFWRDPAFRADSYRDAGVDEGLIQATIEDALEISIDAGLTYGLRQEGVSIAIVAYGDVELSIRTKDLRSDAYRAIGIFEERMRAFVANKLQTKFGNSWFKQRVNGLIVQKAKDIRAAAVRASEDAESLINFVDLGDLKGIVDREDNWADVFHSVFNNKNKFLTDMDTLIALRRPTAHFRKIDALRLTEALIVMERLEKWMKKDGSWKVDIDSDQ